ncbi:MAG: gene transfer agent family protein [Rhizobiales bacterium]|nr:gene transfer agent family protein [Hyphomicrobiales bacterium]
MKTIAWAGGEHAFDLTSRRVSWMLLQSQHPFPGQYGTTPAACLKRFEESIYSPDDIERVLLIGLIGGGLSEADADAIVAEHVRGKPLAPNAAVAFEVLASLFVEVTDAGTSA